MRPKRKPMGGGTVAFIDVMACGLGAVVLLLVIVDFNIVEIIPKVTKPVATSTPEPQRASAIVVEERLSSLQSKNAQLAESIANLTTALVEEEVIKDALKVSIETPVDLPITDPTTNKPGQLIGLQVNGRSIITLLDVSGSMYSSLLVDNVAYAVSPSKTLSDQSAKWSQGKRIAQWCIDVAPENANIKLATFSESVKDLSGGWTKKQDLGPRAQKSLAGIVPQGGTDLQQAFTWLAKNASRGTQVFLITDGLPTKLSSQGLVSRVFSACARDPKGFVSGECRQQIFARSVTTLTQIGVELNVILLPSEGDPSAAPLYWALAESKGGVLFSPELNWP